MADNISRQYMKDNYAQKIEAMLNMARTRRSKFERRWYDNNFFDDGYHFRYVSRTTGKIVDLSTSEFGNSPIRAIPKASRQIRGIANLLMQPSYTPVVYPEEVLAANYTSPEEVGMARAEAKLAAQRTGHWIKEEWKNLEMNDKLTQMLILTMKHGISYMQIWADPIKEITNTKVFDAFDIFVADGSLTSIYDSPFLIKGVPRLISNIMADERFKIEKGGTGKGLDLVPDNKYAASEVKDAYERSRYGSGNEAPEAATLIQKECFVKEYLNNENYEFVASRYPNVIKGKKKGDMVMRHSFVAGGITLRDEYVDLPEYPFVDLRLEPGALYQVPLIERFMAANKTYDVVMSRIERWANTMVTGHWLTRKGESVKINNIPGGQVMEYEGTPPVQGQVQGLPTTLFEFLNRVEKNIEEQGVSASLADLPPGVKSGVAIESLKESEFLNLKIASDQMKITTQRIAKRLLEIADDYFLSPQTIQRLEKGEPDYFTIIGQRGAKLREEIDEPITKDTIVVKKDYNVDIEVETGIAFTREGKKEVMQQILDFMLSLQESGMVNAGAIKVIIRRFFEMFQFGGTAEFMDALDEVGDDTMVDDQTLEKIKIAMLETLKDAGVAGKDMQKQQVDATKMGMLETIADLQKGQNA